MEFETFQHIKANKNIFQTIYAIFYIDTNIPCPTQSNIIEDTVDPHVVTVVQPIGFNVEIS